MSHRTTLIILKFGGASLGTPGRIRRAARRVASFRQRGHDVVVVVSAIGETTDRLLSLAHKVRGAECEVRGDEAERSAPPTTPHSARRTSHRELDRILATGEDLSAALLASAIIARGRAARSLRGGEAGLIARGDHSRGELLDLALSPILDLLRAQVVPIVSGFQAIRLEDGETVTLGRGTSDLTAVFLAARLGAAECHLVKDVDGVYDVDPNRFGDARRHASLNYRDLEAIAAESQIVHAGAAALAREAGVHLRIYGYRAPFRITAEHCTSVGEAA